MAASYITLYRKDKNIISGKLITATEVTPEMEQKMADMIKKKTNGTVDSKQRLIQRLLADSY